MLKAKSSDFAKFAFLRFSLIHHTGMVEKVPNRLINEAAKRRQSWYADMSQNYTARGRQTLKKIQIFKLSRSKSQKKFKGDRRP